MEAKIYDVSINSKENTTLSAPQKMLQATTDLSYINPVNYATFENGGLNFYDDNSVLCDSGDYVGYISNSVSDSNGDIDVSLTIQPKSGYTLNSKGISITFFQNYCSKVSVELFFGGSSIHNSGLLDNDKMIFFYDFGDYKDTLLSKVIVRFTKTQNPSSFIKISGIDMGNVTVIDKFKSVNVLEEINVLSSDCSINTSEFVGVSAVEPNEGQIVTLSNNGKFYGKFYVDEVEKVQNDIYSFQNTSLINKLDTTKFYDWENTSYTANEIVNLIALAANVKIEIDSCFNSYSVYGWIPICSCRYALTQVAWAIGAMIDDSRSDVISVKPVPTTITSVIRSSDKRIIGNAKLKKQKQVSYAEWNIKQYSLQSDSDCKKLFTVESTGLDEGTTFYTEFGKPTYIGVISGNSGGREATPNYISVMLEYGSHDFYGYEYAESIITILIVNDSQNISNTDNVTTFDKYTLLGKDGFDSYEFKREQIKKYIQSKGTITAKIVLRNEKVGDLIQLETAFDGTYTGIITSLNIVSAGFNTIAEVELIEWQIG